MLNIDSNTFWWQLLVPITFRYYLKVCTHKCTCMILCTKLPKFRNLVMKHSFLYLQVHAQNKYFSKSSCTWVQALNTMTNHQYLVMVVFLLLSGIVMFYYFLIYFCFIKWIYAFITVFDKGLISSWIIYKKYFSKSAVQALT